MFNSLFLSLSLLSRIFISVCAWAESCCQGRKVGLNLVYDEDLRLVVCYLMKQDLRGTIYWRKSIGYLKVGHKLHLLMKRAWRRRFLKVLNVFNYVPFEKGMALHLNKLVSPSPKDALCQVWLKMSQWFWRRRF